jgi:putative protein-disulfide isomerase
MSEPVLWYFADPMCSWCWGFTPTFEAIKKNYGGRMKAALILGGLRPGMRAVMPLKERDELLQHWHEVHAVTGQPFQFYGVLVDDFIYDTEPASRAVVAMGQIEPDAVFPMFKAIQTAFYADGRDVTRPKVLAELAADSGVGRDDFMAAFNSVEVRNKTLAHFQLARSMNVRGFPTLVLQRGDQHRILSSGYRPLAELQPDIDAWLAGDELAPGSLAKK